jgi:hypothetical protein
VLVSGARLSYPGALVDAVLAAVVVLLVAWWWCGALRRFRAVAVRDAVVAVA